MRGRSGLKTAAALMVMVSLVAVPVLQASAVGRLEVGVGVPISTSFSFSSFGYGLEIYARLLGAALMWETALKTDMSFSALYIRNTLATAAALHLFIGHVTNLLPYFGSTYFTLGLGLTFGSLIVTRLAVAIAVSISQHGVYWFPELRFQVGLDP